MAHLVDSYGGGYEQPMSPDTLAVYVLSEQGYERRVSRGEKWLYKNYGADAHSLYVYQMDRKTLWSVYRGLIEVCTPEFFNVIDGCGIWRIPYFHAEGPGRYLTEAIGIIMVLLGGLQIYGVGSPSNHGDIIMRALLTEAEISELEHGRFPRTLEPYGIPGPGVCGESNEVLVVETTTTSGPPPRGPRAIGPVNDDYGGGYGAAPAHPHGPPRQSGPPRQNGPLHEPRQPRHPGQSDRPRQRPRKYIVSSSDSSSSSESDDEAAPAKRGPKNKAKGTKPKGKPIRRQKSPPTDDDSEDGDFTLSGDEHRGPHKQKHLTAKPTRRIGRADDGDSPHPGRRSAAQGPPRRGLVPKAGMRDDDFLAPGGPPRTRGSAPGPTRRIGRSDDEDDNPPPGRRAAAPGPVPREKDGAPRPSSRSQGRRLGAAHASGHGGRNREGIPSDDDEPPEMDPAEKARLDALKEANGFGKRKHKDEKKGLH